MRTQFFPWLSNMKLLGLFLSIKLSLLTLTHITTPNMVSAVVSQNTTIQFIRLLQNRTTNTFTRHWTLEECREVLHMIEHYDLRK